jgi:parallel beta-helix repeat protein
MVDRLSDGQTGCFAQGTYNVPNYKLTKSGITLTSLDDANATLKGRFWIAADRVTFEGLTLNNENQADLPTSITGADVVLRDNDITNDHTTICMNIGNAAFGRAQDTLIEGNRIHDCGRLPAGNFDHGIYVEDSNGVVIRDNWIYGNADRGIQLYPDADNTLIERNVIDRNGEGIIFGGSPDGASDDTIVRNNLITNSRLRDNVESAYGPGEPVGKNNIVTNNCISGGAYDDGDGGILQDAEGFTEHSNLIVDPGYVNAAAGNYTLKAGSPCAALLAGGELETKLSLKSSKRRVHTGRKLRLKGKALGAARVTVKVQRGGAWRAVDTSKVRNGKFSTKIKPRRPGKAHFKAVAKDAESGAVKVQVRR